MSDDAGIFGWRNADILIICEFRDGRWLLSRSWIGVDRLEHVRRWDFDSAHLLLGQIRRLVRDATGNEHEADEAIDDARRWISAVGPASG